LAEQLQAASKAPPTDDCDIAGQKCFAVSVPNGFQYMVIADDSFTTDSIANYAQFYPDTFTRPAQPERAVGGKADPYLVDLRSSRPNGLGPPVTDPTILQQLEPGPAGSPGRPPCSGSPSRLPRSASPSQADGLCAVSAAARAPLEPIQGASSHANTTSRDRQCRLPGAGLPLDDRRIHKASVFYALPAIRRRRAPTLGGIADRQGVSGSRRHCPDARATRWPAAGRTTFFCWAAGGLPTPEKAL